MTALIATAVAFLSMGTAHRSIQTIERDYWHGGTTYVTDCHRHARNKVKCIAHTTIIEPGLKERITIPETVTLERGYIRVHPGAEVIESEETL